MTLSAIALRRKSHVNRLESINLSKGASIPMGGRKPRGTQNLDWLVSDSGRMTGSNPKVRVWRQPVKVDRFLMADQATKWQDLGQVSAMAI